MSRNRNGSSISVGNYMKEITSWVRELSFEDLSQEVIEQSKLVLLDTLGVLLAASSSRHSTGRILREFVRQSGGAQESSIVGGESKTSCVNAALVNATLGYYCDMDAVYYEAIMHPAAIIVPTALAVGEREGVSGEEFLLSVIVGTDIACRVSLALNPRALYRQGFHPTAIAGSFGAAAAAGKVLKLDQMQLCRAFGLAGNQTCGLLSWKQDPSENSRPFNPGVAARNGVTASLLAKLGFGGPDDIFEGAYNIFMAYSNGEEDLDRLTLDLGKKFMMMGLSIKRYSCVGSTHAGLDALLTIMSDNNLEVRDIDRIVLRFPKSGAGLIDSGDLRSHSSQYIFAVAASDRRVAIDDILCDRSSEPEIRNLMNKIEVVGDDELDAVFPERRPAIVELTTTSGHTCRERVDYAKGHPKNPLSKEETEEKFFSLSKQVIGQSAAEKILKVVNGIDSSNEISTLTALL